MKTVADVVVIGLGAMGAATLYQLAKRGVTAIGIDRYAPPHEFGSSHGETRITRLAIGEGAAYVPLVQRSHAIWRELEAATGTSLLHEIGGLILGPRETTALHHGQPSFVGRTIAVAERMGVRHDVLTAAEVMARYPQFVLRGDETGYFEPTAGYVVPERCIAAQLARAEALGASVRLGETVRSVRQVAGGVECVTDRATISAGRAVVTAGAWIAELLGPPVASVTTVYRQTLHWFAPAKPDDYAPARFPIFIWMHGHEDGSHFYGFPMLADGAGVKVATETYERETTPGTVDRTVSSDDSTAMFARHVEGRLAGVTATARRTAACLYTVTPDGGFVVDEMPGADRITIVSACSGHGFKHSAGLGEAVAQRVSGAAVDVALEAFALGRFAGY